ncbi:hypothetical protein N7474_003801 [Penicillium riverlandense]|uniref:uncharacterized protein n=1 Tax=Penicillium riverlandense TaxID=1903569 RepID=UPI002546B467|nr:uncharacterized protein N7474_003801 [Penicillium riverlandense]KAJ5818210.1 hypothetical protein N7474_003801 [Penicillium riverlandense]
MSRESSVPGQELRGRPNRRGKPAVRNGAKFAGQGVEMNTVEVGGLWEKKRWEWKEDRLGAKSNSSPGSQAGSLGVSPDEEKRESRTIRPDEDDDDD